MPRFEMVTDSRNSAPAQTREELCEKHGKFTSQLMVVSKSFQHWSSCPACQQEREQRLRAMEEQERLEAIERRKQYRIENCMIPIRFELARLTNYSAETEAQKRALGAARDYVANFSDHLSAGRCMIFLGKVGTGKTHLACAIARELAEAHSYRTRYTTASETIRRIRGTWRKESQASEADILQELQGWDLLVLDEVGMQFGSEAEIVQLSEVIDLRYKQELPTLIISNCDLAGLTRYLGERAVDRLRDNGGQLVAFDWESWRKRKPEHLDRSQNPAESGP